MHILYYLNQIMIDLPNDSEIINFGLHGEANLEHFIEYNLMDDKKDEILHEKK